MAGTGERMRLDFEQLELTALKRLRRTVGEAPGQRGLPGTRRTHQQDYAMERQDAAIDLAPDAEIQHRLRDQLVLDRLVQNDRVPEATKRRVRQRPYALNALGSVKVGMRRHNFSSFSFSEAT
jgi:hypothetical protein